MVLQRAVQLLSPLFGKVRLAYEDGVESQGNPPR